MQSSHKAGLFMLHIISSLATLENNGYYTALRHQNIVYKLSGGKQTSKSQETWVPYSSLTAFLPRGL